MGAAISLIPELEAVIQNGTRRKRIEALQRITKLFVDGASSYSDAHIELFDDVFVLLIEEIETKARAELSTHLAPVNNAPVRVLRTLARDDDIDVAGPVLTLATRLADADLIEVARTKSQAHLQAISSRATLGEAVTDVLVRRGDRNVACCVADNRGARLSVAAFSRLVKRAEDDGVLAEKVGLRPDLPAPLFRELLSRATAVVHARLLASAPPEMKAQLSDVLDKISQEVGARVAPRDYRAAQRVVLNMQRAGRLDEMAVAAFCGENKYEEIVVALAILAKVPVNLVDRLMGGQQSDAVLILCKAIAFSWPTVRALIMARPRHNGTSNLELNAAFANYDRLSASTARRVVRFWQVRQS